MRARPSTLLTSPVSQLDFVVRLGFFATAPFAIVSVAAFFPVTGTLVGVVLVTVVALAGEAIRGHAARFPWLARLLARELELEAYYRERPPRPFLYYVFYPLLAPYWLADRDARREFWLYKGWTASGVALLVATSAVQFVRSWRPDLGVREYLPVFGITLAIDAVLALSLLMPIVTTVIDFHRTFRRGRLKVLLVVALVSASLGVVRLVHRRDPIVSWATRERAVLRRAAIPKKTHDAEVTALREAWKHVRQEKDAIEDDGKIEGDPLDAARAQLSKVYKPDETLAFDLWASPRGNPRVLVLYVTSRRKKSTAWVAMNRAGQQLVEAQLPANAWASMQHAAQN